MAKIYKQKDVSLERLSNVVGITDGGLGTTSIAEIKSTLNYIESSSYGQPNGVVKLNHLGKIDSSLVPGLPSPQLSSLDGPKYITVGSSSKVYTIANYSNFYTYTVTVSAGTFTRTDDVITYTPPATAQDITITLKSVNTDNSIDSTAIFKVTITTINTPNRPTIVYPTNGTTRVSSSVTLESSQFSIDGSFTHTNSDWEVSKNNTFSTLVASSYNSVLNKLVFNIVELEEDTTYYARVRHTGSNGIKSLWSDVSTFTTVTDFDTSYHILTDQHPISANEHYGTSVLLSEDEDFWIGGAPGKNNGEGTVELHFKDKAYTPSAHIWRLRSGSNIKPTLALKANSNFGYSMDIDATSTRLVVGAPGTTIDGKVNAGCVYIFKRIDTTYKWDIETILTATDGLANDRFGHSVSINRGAFRVVVGAPNAISNVLNGTGRVYVYDRNNITWTNTSTIKQSDDNNYQLFGYSIAISGDGSHIHIGTPGNSVNRNSLIAFYRYETNHPNLWHYHGEIKSPELSSEFGKSISLVNSSELNDTYDLLVVGAPASNGNRGSVYVYKNIIKVNTQQFVQIAKLESDNEYDERFGESVTTKTNGRMIYVGAPRGRTRHSNGSGSIVKSGCVYAYKVSNDAVTYFDKIVGSSRDNIGSFGYSVFAARNPDSKYLFVGDPEESNGFPNTGAIYVFN